MKQTIYKSTIFFFFISLIISCGSSKEVENPQPNWLVQKPIDNEYFYGVGKSHKYGDPTKYISKARGEALNDLAQEVSVNISSKSVLYKFENETGISEYYQDRINTSSKDYLEGFTPVDSYENQNAYWAFYKIKKTTYYRIKEERKQKAFNEAYALYNEGKSAEKANYVDAFKKYILSFERIKNYLGEDMIYQMNGEDFNISKEILVAIQNCLNQIKFNVPNKKLNYKRGDQILLDDSIITLVNLKNNPLEEYPIILNSKALEIYKTKRETNTSGSLDFDFKLNSTNDLERLNIEFDWRFLVNSTTNDLLIRKILSVVNVPKTELTFQIEQPKLFLNSSNATNLTQSINQSILSYFQKKKIKSSTESKARNIFKLSYKTKKYNSKGRIVFEISYVIKKQRKVVLENVFSKSFDKNMYGSFDAQELWKKTKSEFERKHLNSIYKKMIQE